MKYYFIAGEASGDLHASHLIAALKAEDPDAEFRGFGGDLMAAQGMTLVCHYRDLAFMGFVAVVLHARTMAARCSHSGRLPGLQPENCQIRPFHRHLSRLLLYRAEAMGLEGVAHQGPQARRG